MALIVKPLVCVGCLAGVGSAIGVPVTYAVKNSGGGGNLTSSVNMQRCSTIGPSNVDTISYGTQGDMDVCGFVSPIQNAGSEIGEDKDQKLTNLLKNMGDHKTLSGSEAANSNWKAQCTLNGKTGYLSKSDGEEYLGICDSSSDTQKRGVTIENKNSGQLKITVCQGECGQPSSDKGTDIQVLSNKSGNGHEVKFRKNSSEDSVRSIK